MSAPAEVDRLQQVFWRLSSELLLVADRDGIVQAGNPAWDDLLGWEHDGSRRGLHELVHPDDRPAVVEALASLRLGGHVSELPLRMRTRAGHFRRIAWSGVTDGDLWYAAGRDITDAQDIARVADEAAAFWHATMDSIPGQVAVLDESAVIVAVNAAWREFGAANGSPPGEFLGDSYLEVCDVAAALVPEAARVAGAIRGLLEGGESGLTLDYLLGDRVYTVTVSGFSGDGAARVVVSHLDITDRRALERETRVQAAIIDQFSVGVVATDPQGYVTQWSEGAQNLYGWTREEAVGTTMHELVHPRVIDEDAPVDGRLRLSRKDGSTFVGHVRWAPLDQDDGVTGSTIGFAIDLSQQVQLENEALEARNYMRAVTDSMTEGLFALSTDGAVTWMNDAAEGLLGWPADEVRGRRLHDVVHPQTDKAVHAPGDCRLLDACRGTHLSTVDDDAFTRSDGAELPVSYTVTPLETAQGVEGCVVVFMDATHVRAEQERLTRELSAVAWIQRVQAALDQDRLTLFAQPIIDLASGRATQHELLLRVREPSGEIVGPGPYLATAEEYGLIGDIDTWVIQRSMALAALGMAVELNVSAATVSDPTMVDQISQWLASSGADPSLMVFEITETALITNERAAGEFVEGVHGLGCKVALDDFGTGYGGFTYLKNMPVDYLKIDIEFVRDLCVNPASQHVVEAVVNLATSFHMLTVAEGVEDAQTLRLLTELGVDLAQGFHLGRPAPIIGDRKDLHAPH